MFDIVCIVDVLSVISVEFVEIGDGLTDGRIRTQFFIPNDPNGLHLSATGELLT